MDGKRNRFRWLLTSKIRRDSKPNCVYFGDGGRQAGPLYAAHGVTADSKGNTLETTDRYRGQRVWKSACEGMGL
jgi:hypothetical protein